MSVHKVDLTTVSTNQSKLRKIGKRVTLFWHYWQVYRIDRYNNKEDTYNQYKRKEVKRKNLGGKLG